MLFLGGGLGRVFGWDLYCSFCGCGATHMVLADTGPDMFAELVCTDFPSGLILLLCGILVDERFISSFHASPCTNFITGLTAMTGLSLLSNDDPCPQLDPLPLLSILEYLSSEFIEVEFSDGG